MSGLFGPQTANAVTSKPNTSAIQRYGAVQTWFRDCSGPGASDGTVPDAAFFNRIVGALDYICGASGVSGIAGDDSILYRAILQTVSQDAPDALNSLRELADAIADDPNFAGTIMSMLANRLRFDQSQFLNSTQKAQALANLGLALATVASSGAYADLTGRPTLGTAAALNVGTGANQIVQLDGSSKLPAVDASQLINVTPGTGALRYDIAQGALTTAQKIQAQNNAGLAVTTAPAAGMSGERVTGGASANFTTSATDQNFGSFTLQPGVWDIELGGTFNGSGSTTSSDWVAAVSTVNASTATGLLATWHQRAPSGLDYSWQVAVPRTRVVLSVATTYYINAKATFSTSTFAFTPNVVATRV